MTDKRWEQYPLVKAHDQARKWLQRQAYLQLAPATIDAYGRCLNDYLGFCAKHDIRPEALTREHVALYVQDLSSRPNPKGANILSLESGRGLSNSTLQQRITVLRLFCDSLIEGQLRQDNLVGRGHYVPGKAFGGIRDRGLLPHYHKLPWTRLLQCCKKGGRVRVPGGNPAFSPSRCLRRWFQRRTPAVSVVWRRPLLAGCEKRVMEQPPKPSHPSRKRTSALEVQTMFEPSRLAQQCLQNAYACLIPPLHRRVGSPQLHQPFTHESARPDGERTAQ
jgi:hypothetical protein